MVRMQVSLTESQAQQLRDRARAQGTSIAALLRHGADLVLERDGVDTWEERRRRALAAVGAFRGDASDVARRHDDYLDEIYGT